MGLLNGTFAEPLAVHLDFEKFYQNLDLAKFSPKPGLSQISTKMVTGSRDLAKFQKTWT
jgi:hypothetical protein